MVCNSREPWRKSAGQMQTFLYHVSRLDKILAGWLVCWVAAAGKSCKPGSETAFAFKIHIFCSQSCTQGGRSTCRMKSDLDARCPKNGTPLFRENSAPRSDATTTGNVSSSYNGKIWLSHKLPCSIDLHHTAERSFPSWKGPSGVGCKTNLFALC